MVKKYAGPMVAKVRMAIWSTHPHVCHLCGEPINSFREFEPDHLVPRALGGSLFDLRNLRPAHGTFSRQKCNQKRGSKALVPTVKNQDNLGWFL